MLDARRKLISAPGHEDPPSHNQKVHLEGGVLQTKECAECGPIQDAPTKLSCRTRSNGKLDTAYRANCHASPTNRPQAIKIADERTTRCSICIGVFLEGNAMGCPPVRRTSARRVKDESPCGPVAWYQTRSSSASSAVAFRLAPTPNQALSSRFSLDRARM